MWPRVAVPAVPGYYWLDDVVDEGKMSEEPEIVPLSRQRADILYTGHYFYGPTLQNLYGI